MSTVELRSLDEETPVASGLVDCDVHNAMKNRNVLKQYLPARWHVDYDHGSHIGGHGGQVIGARPHPDIFRQDSKQVGRMPGSDLDFMREQLLDRFAVRQAILSPLDVLGWPTYGEAAAAMTSALNDWMVDEWLTRDERLYGAISMPVEDGPRAAEVIDRAVASSSRFVTILMTMVTREGFGHPKYWPIYEAAERHGLPIAAHVGGFSGTHSATGWPTYFVEQHAGYTQPYAAQIVSLVHSGVFDQFPGLKIVLEEGGVAWMPSLMWRLDRTWESLGEHVPHMTRRPSQVIREHIWFTTQPFDEPEKPAYLPHLLEQLGMDDHLMFATDYPHWDFDDPARILPKALIGAELRERIMLTNAQALFGFSSD